MEILQTALPKSLAEAWNTILAAGISARTQTLELVTLEKSDITLNGVPKTRTDLRFYVLRSEPARYCIGTIIFHRLSTIVNKHDST